MDKKEKIENSTQAEADHYNGILLEDMRSQIQLVIEKVMGSEESLRGEMQLMRTDFEGRFQGLEALIKMNSDDIKTNSEEIHGHSKILASHSKILESHSKILASHSTVLESHTKTLDEHSRSLDRIETKLDRLVDKVEKHDQALHQMGAL